ncbi:hypothetical protein [Comamonas sp. NoAH]|uniref:hypothetical protein n=1 Tax=Comamonas halotolerans TaxID=3041496 RepID=UPI0024E069D3|nr:hypothetical protein [Comamonas sp. NoAH]
MSYEVNIISLVPILHVVKFHKGLLKDKKPALGRLNDIDISAPLSPQELQLLSLEVQNMNPPT